MENNDEKKILKVREATIEELLEWGIKCQRELRKDQKIINADRLVFVPHPPVKDPEETEWVESSDHDSISWRKK